MDELIVISEPLKCNFCKMKVNDVIKFGPLYKLGKVRAHYFCVLLSHGLIQNGNDEEGMLGFLLKDIKEGLRKTKTTMCTYCGKKNASIICSGKRCPKKFHLPCGLENGSLHQFMHEFKSFCRIHRPVQSIPDKILKDAIRNGTICCICYERVEVTRKAENVLWAPCCRKTWYHRYCVQKLAHSAGYFFKCAACNDTQKFKARMERFGIYIPQQDASWERVPNAFAELHHRHDTCDAEICKCPDGRQKDEENTIFEIILCRSCGAQGVHVLCGGLTLNDPNWECDVCRAVVTKSSDSKLTPEAAREMKECFLKKAGKSSSGLVNEAWPPPAEEGATESIKVGTTSTDERDVEESEKGESRKSGEITEEQEKEEEEEALQDEIMEDRGNTKEEEQETVENEIIEEQEYAQEEEKAKVEETLQDGIMGEQAYIEEQGKWKREESVIIIAEGEREEKDESKELAKEQEEGEGEESVIIIAEGEREEKEESKELSEEEEKEEADESVILIEQEREMEGESEGVMEEQDKYEKGGIVQQREREEEEKRGETSLVRPIEGSSVSTKSPVRRRRKRWRNFEGLENFVTGKRRKVRTTCREEQDGTEKEEDEIVVDVESLSEKWKDGATQTEKTEEDSDRVGKEPGEPRTSKGIDFREVMKAIKPAPLSHKISVLRKALERSSSARHRRESLALFPQYKDIKPGPLCYKMDMFKRALERKEQPLRYADIKSGPSTCKRSIARGAGRKMSPSELKNTRRRVTPTLPMPKMSIIGMEPSASASSDYREGYLGMTSVVADFEDLGMANLDRLREEHEVELEEWDGNSEGSRRTTRRVAGGMTGGVKREKKDVSTQTNFRVRIWIMPSRSLPLRNYLQLQQKKGEGGGPS